MWTILPILHCHHHFCIITVVPWRPRSFCHKLYYFTTLLDDDDVVGCSAIGSGWISDSVDACKQVH